MWVKADNKVVMDKQLHIKNVTTNEQGIYRCIAVNGRGYGHGFDEKSYHIEIISKLLSTNKTNQLLCCS